jgi:hypothetical protein
VPECNPIRASAVNGYTGHRGRRVTVTGRVALPSRRIVHLTQRRAPRALHHLPIVLLVLAQLFVAPLTLSVSQAALAADLFTELRSFQGVVLVPTADLDPFTALEAWRVEMNRPVAGSSAVVRGRYLIQYRDADGGAGSAQIGGAMGREELDQTLMALASRSFTRCPEDAGYCVENVAGQDGAPPASELFRGVTVNDGPAVVEHVVCCGGHYWSLTWYEAARDMTYTMILVGPVADQYGAGIAAENVSVATALAGIAGRLTPLE